MSRPAQRTGRSGSSTPTKPVRRQRGPRFYAAFGIVGLVLSGILIETTIVSYNHDKSAYPAAQAAYQKSLAAYHTALAKYQAAVAHHVKPVPAMPHAPAAPHVPTISAASFALPVLYAVLSLAYLFLAYRASRQNQAGGTTTTDQVKTANRTK